MPKISFEDWKNSMSFMIDDDFDNNFLLSIEPLANYINANCDQFGECSFNCVKVLTGASPSQI